MVSCCRSVSPTCFRPQCENSSCHMTYDVFKRRLLQFSKVGAPTTNHSNRVNLRKKRRQTTIKSKTLKFLHRKKNLCSCDLCVGSPPPHPGHCCSSTEREHRNVRRRQREPCQAKLHGGPDPSTAQPHQKDNTNKVHSQGEATKRTPNHGPAVEI